MNARILLPAIVATLLCIGRLDAAGPPFLAQGELVGDVTSTTAIDPGGAEQIPAAGDGRMIGLLHDRPQFAGGAEGLGILDHEGHSAQGGVIAKGSEPLAKA